MNDLDGMNDRDGIKPTDSPDNTAPQLPVVMIVDDSPVQTSIFRRLAKGIAANFIIVESWEKAVNAIDSQRLDIVITDYNLDEGRTGVDLVKNLQSAGQTSRCFFMTTESPTGIRQQLGDYKAAGFLVKPVNFKKFKLFMEKQIGVLKH